MIRLNYIDLLTDNMEQPKYEYEFPSDDVGPWKRFMHNWHLVRLSFDISPQISQNNKSNKHSNCRWFGTSWHSCDVTLKRKRHMRYQA